jgi:hypothetical protein
MKTYSKETKVLKKAGDTMYRHFSEIPKEKREDALQEVANTLGKHIKTLNSLKTQSGSDEHLLRAFHVLIKFNNGAEGQKHYFVRALNAGDAVSFADWIFTRQYPDDMKGNIMVNEAYNLVGNETLNSLPDCAEVYSL